MRWYGVQAVNCNSLLFGCFNSSSVSRSRSGSRTKKRSSRSRSPVRERNARRRSRSRSPVRSRSRSLSELRASKRGPHTPPGSPRQNSQSGSLTNKRPSRSRSPVGEGSAHRSPVKSHSNSPLEHRVSRTGPHTPSNGSPQRESQSQTAAEHRSTSPAADREVIKGHRTPPIDGAMECDGSHNTTTRDGSLQHGSKKADETSQHSYSPTTKRSCSPSRAWQQERPSRASESNHSAAE